MSQTGTAATSATTFSELVAELKTDAVAEVAKLKADAVAFEHTIVPIVESDIVTVLGQFKSLAITTTLNLAKTEFAALSGQEKQSTVVTTVYQAAQASGASIAIQDVRMFAQQAFDAVATALGTAS